MQHITEKGAEVYHFAPCGFFQISHDEIVQQINQTLLDWLGYTGEEVLNKKKWTDFLTMGAKIYHQTHFTPLLNMQGTLEEVNLDMRKKDGEKISMLVNAHLKRKSDATIEAIYFSVFRFTQRKQYEVELMKAEQKIKAQNEDLIASEEELKMSVEELQTTQTVLATQNIELEKTLLTLTETQGQLIQAEKMASLGQLVTSVAHEINTPIGAIRSSVETNSIYLQDILQTLPTFIAELSNENRTLFVTILQILLKAPKLNLSSREQRKERQAIEQKLESIQQPHALEIADKIIDMGIYFDLWAHESLYKNPNLYEIIIVLHKIIVVISSNQNIKTATNLVGKIVFALKNFSRQDYTDTKISSHIHEGIETVLTIYSSQIKQGIDVVCNFADLPEILCYPDELVQVWTNIIHNAIHAMNSKGTLTIATQIQQNYALISIHDTGHGIPQDIQDKIFNAFFTTKKIGEGSGLGLDIVKKIIDKHAGKIWFESEAGKGTTFFVEIPVE